MRPSSSRSRRARGSNPLTVVERKAPHRAARPETEKAGATLPLFLLFLGVFFWGSSGAAIAQSAGEDQGIQLAQADTVGDSNETQIVIISIERVLRESAAGRSIQAQAQELRAAQEAQRRAQEEALLTEERELVELRQQVEQADFDRDEFDARARAFEEKVQALRVANRENAERVQRALQEATDELKRRLQPILIAIMDERRAAVMLDDSTVVLSATVIDVTNEAIRRLDAEVPFIELRVTLEPE